MRLKGYIFAAIAAATYGTNPAFAVPLYADGMNPNSVLLFRYLLGLPILAAMMAWRGRSLRLQRGEAGPLMLLGVLMALSSLSLFQSYEYMNSGVASTLLFVYPIMVALLMTFFFKERLRVTTFVCLALMGAGVVMLMRGGGDVSVMGCVLVMVSAFTYAIYLVLINVSDKIREVPTLKLMFYVLLFGSGVFLFMLLFDNPLTVPSDAGGWGFLVALAVLPTVVSLGCTTLAIQCIGSTPTAIMGALEPVTAVLLSVFFLGQGITVNEIWGALLIITATTIVIAADRVESVILRVRKMFPSLRR